MTDVHAQHIRSYNMRMIKCKNTKPEIIVRKFLFSKGFRYRLHDKKLPGKPDIVLSKYNTIIFIHGCFWHGHSGCKYYVVPKTRTNWWLNKINRNKELDKINSEKLDKMGWIVIVVYECELQKGKKEITLTKLIKSIISGNTNN